MDKSLHNSTHISEVLGHTFESDSLLQEALTHPSITAVNDIRNYERLEFLGDRVLGLIIAGLLFEKFPDDNEGMLALRFSNLVRKEALVRVAEKIGLEQFVIMTKAMRKAGAKHQTSIMADCCEAIIAALYLDGGLEAASRFVKKHWEELIASSTDSRKDAKSSLQEWAQKRSKPIPTYTMTKMTGPDNNPQFTIEVLVEGLPIVTARGSSKRDAEQAAAAKLMKEIAEQYDD